MTVAKWNDRLNCPVRLRHRSKTEEQYGSRSADVEARRLRRVSDRICMCKARLWQRFLIPVIVVNFLFFTYLVVNLSSSLEDRLMLQ
ncbi:hypothetical protein COOONC_06110 [Cooperia oncophora]